ncbi:MAG: hypothetical protein HUK04_03725 [Bacteroidaceae bacterium]|nr:hypothetical protein [Bacteroidaceae bacterium]
MQWFEELPHKCPPDDAQPANGEYYRIANQDPAQSDDFFSQRKLQPLKAFQGIDECTTMALFVFDDKQTALNLLKLPKFRNAHIVKVTLMPTDGMTKKTFGPHHFSWWRTTQFQPSKAVKII